MLRATPLCFSAIAISVLQLICAGSAYLDTGRFGHVTLGKFTHQMRICRFSTRIRTPLSSRMWRLRRQVSHRGFWSLNHFFEKGRPWVFRGSWAPFSWPSSKRNWLFNGLLKMFLIIELLQGNWIYKNVFNIHLINNINWLFNGLWKIFWFIEFVKMYLTWIDYLSVG